jgi:hypothetical protein
MTTFTTEDRLSAVTIQYPERLLEQGSEAWKQARLGHVTASNVADVMARLVLLTILLILLMLLLV